MSYAIAVGLAGCSADNRDIILLAPPVLPAEAQPDGIDWRPFDDALARHVTAAGRVDYFRIVRDDGLEPLVELYGRLARVGPHNRPDTFATRDDRLAYYINAHNLLAVLAIGPHFGPGRAAPRGLCDLPAPLGGGHVFVLDGRQVTLDGIRDLLIVPLLEGDPRPLLALCAGRRNDPPLRNEIYSPERLDEQLDDQLRRILRQSPWCEIDFVRRRIELPLGIVENPDYYRTRYEAASGVSANDASLATVLMSLADERGRAWLNRGISYQVVAARPSTQFNDRPLFRAGHD